MIRLRKHIQVLGILLALVCTSTSTWAMAEVSDLFKAAYDGDLYQVKALIAAQVDVNAKIGDGATALMAASQNGHQEVVQVLITAKADVVAIIQEGILNDSFQLL
jgi:uncharacterized protein